ncbi:MAG TPA: substrate-binding domain-containing protein [Terriglobales bacterium]|nr:substrate-binding domain-containing protein [Terriglobales bacterium]
MHFYFERKSRYVLLVFCLAAIAGHAQEIKVMTSGGFSAAYRQLMAQYSSEHGIRFETISGPSMGSSPTAIPSRLHRGETADVIIMVRESLDALVKNGEVIDGSTTDLARSRIGMAVRAGAAKPDISSVEAFRQTLLRARSVAYSDSASGEYIKNDLYKRLGIEKEMAAKSRQIQAEPVGMVVARGEADLGFQQMSELIPISGITIVGPIPEELQKTTVFSAGIAKRSTAPESARVFIHYLASPAACELIKEAALDPIACLPSPSLPKEVTRPNPQLTIPYGAPISVENAKKAAAAAVAEANKNNWRMAIAVTDVGGELVYFEKVEGTQTASVQIAIDKARSTVLFKRPTKWFEDELASQGIGLRVLGLRGAVPVDGGVPLVVDGRVVGGIGISGGTNRQDGHCAETGAAALK